VFSGSYCYAVCSAMHHLSRVAASENCGHID